MSILAGALINSRNTPGSMIEPRDYTYRTRFRWNNTKRNTIPDSHAENCKKELFEEPVVRRFIGDQDIVGVAFGHTGIRDPDELRLGVQLGDRPGTRVSHC